MNCKKIRRNLLDIEDLSLDFSNLSEDLHDHILDCGACGKFYRELCQIQQNLRKFSKTRPPQAIIENYLSDIKRKLRSQELSAKKFQSPVLDILRPVVASTLIVLVFISAWWFGIRSELEVDPENLATDTLEYYLESFDQESSQNPITFVKGLEYEWAYFRMVENGK